MTVDSPNKKISERPPGASALLRAIVSKAASPIERFFAIETASGIILLLAALAAMILANSPWREAYTSFWHLPLGFNFGAWNFEKDLHFWVNDGLMTIFFFLAGLEIRREMHQGELSSVRRAALPLIAALGGMLVPACIYYFINRGHDTVGGWGIPMATDIAFAVGVLALLGKRVPNALRVLLLSLAVVDDVGAIIVIAIFYSADIYLAGFAMAVAGVAIIILMQKMGLRSHWMYIFPSILCWAGMHQAGIHPSLAGVVVGLMTPVRAWFGPENFLDYLDSISPDLRNLNSGSMQTLGKKLYILGKAQREVLSPLDRLQAALHGLVAFGIMPLFAFANAGVFFGEVSFDGSSDHVFWGVGLGLLFGKAIGVLLFTWVAYRLKLVVLPNSVGWGAMVVMSLCAGIGFTMALFIAQLAFPSGVNLEAGKIGILLASAVAGVLALLLGLKILPKKT